MYHLEHRYLILFPVAELVAQVIPRVLNEHINIRKLSLQSEIMCIHCNLRTGSQLSHSIPASASGSYSSKSSE